MKQSNKNFLFKYPLKFPYSNIKTVCVCVYIYRHKSTYNFKSIYGLGKKHSFSFPLQTHKENSCIFAHHWSLKYLLLSCVRFSKNKRISIIYALHFFTLKSVDIMKIRILLLYSIDMMKHLKFYAIWKKIEKGSFVMSLIVFPIGFQCNSKSAQYTWTNKSNKLGGGGLAIKSIKK